MIAREVSSQPPSVSSMPGRTAAIRSTGSLKPMTPVLATATSYGVALDDRRGGFGHRDRVALALLAGARVRVARVHDDRAERSALDVATGDDARRGDDLVRREHRRRGARPLGHDERDVEPLGSPVLHAGLRGTGAEAVRERDAAPLGHGQSGSASRPIVSG